MILYYYNYYRDFCRAIGSRRSGPVTRGEVFLCRNLRSTGFEPPPVHRVRAPPEIFDPGGARTRAPSDAQALTATARSSTPPPPTRYVVPANNRFALQGFPAVPGNSNLHD